MLDDLGEGLCDDETQVVGEGQRHVRSVHHGQVAMGDIFVFQLINILTN